ncbi:cytochrome P450 [Actinophytocola sp.]|uniref:cytochrome P450 n=1 Tax=Actinophytocola sp. TaxID=1872138 RepID=UPI003D6A9BD9
MAAQCPVRPGSYNPFVNPQRDDPHPVWHAAREQLPVQWSEVLVAWVVTRYDLVRQAVSTPAIFRNVGSTAPVRPVPAEVTAVLDRGLPLGELRSTVARDGDEHRRIRKFLVSVLTPRRFGGIEEQCRSTANQLIDRFIGEGKVDLVEAFAYRLPLAVIVELMATPHADAEKLHDWSSKKMALQWGELPLEDHLEAAEAYLEFQEYLLAVVRDRRARPGTDVISELIGVQVDERPLTDAEIVGVMMGFVAAGHETTMNFLALTVLHCLERPGTWQSLVDDPRLIPKLVEESLRFDSPAQAIWRTVGEDTELGGVALAAGARVLLVLASANRDAEVYADADVMTPTRDHESPHLAFGRGVHACVGAGLARLEGKVALAELTRRLPDLRLADGFTPSFAPNAVQRFLDTLPVEWHVAR